MSQFPRIRAMRLLAAGALMLVACTAFASSGGPPNGRTGAPGESTCTACHNSFPLNSGSGEITLAGLPDSYTAGQDYDLTMTLSDPDASRWGFELTFLDEAGDSMGDLVVTDSGTQTSDQGSRTYLKQNSSGTSPGTTGSKSWTFSWTAPAEGTGPMMLYVAGNAANNNGGTSGDRIYATDFMVSEAVVGVDDLPLAFELRGAFPNPFNPSTQIKFDLGHDAHVRVTVMTIDGRRVTTLADEYRSEGPQTLAWDGRDSAGRTMGSGNYLFVVEANGQRQVGRMTMIK